MPEPEDVVIQLLLALLYFVGVYITTDVFWPDQAFQYALIGLIAAMVGYLLLYAVGLHKPGPVVGLYIALAISLITFGLIWQVVRVLARLVDQWPLDAR